MARALVGYVGSSNAQTLALEVVRLRRRVAALETEIAQLRERPSSEIDLELHRITESAAPALA